jgi:hypothetical protein
MSNQSETPEQEARSMIAIAAIIMGVVCFVGALNNIPVLSPFLFWVSELVYTCFPILNALKSPQIPMLVSAATVAGIFWLIGNPFAGLLAQAFASGQVAQMERQTKKLKRNRARIKARQRQQDDFTAF